MNDIYKVAIIGAGSIGANKPNHVDGPSTENILTHAHAVFQHPRTELQAIVDTDKDQLNKAVTKWNPVRAFNSISEFEADPDNADIIIVGVPTEQHYKVLSQIGWTSKRPKLIIAEKPFCNNFSEAREIHNLYNQSSCPILVNYVRRFCPTYRKIKSWIDYKKFGKPLNCRVLYTRGLRHEGCHAIDLMNWFFGKCHYNFFYNGPMPQYIVDRTIDDPSITAVFEYEKCPSVIFQPCDGRKYGIFEIDICFEEGRIRLIDNGLYFERYPVNTQNEWGHKSLSYKLTEIIRQETQLNFGMYYMINNAIDFLDGKERLFCTAEDAIEVHRILTEI